VVPLLRYAGSPDGIHSFIPKIQFRVNFGGPLEWQILVYLLATWYTYLRTFGIFYSNLIDVVVTPGFAP
jgi:hypothetical protein